MVNILCLIGKAGSGKDTVREKFQYECSFKYLVPGTTRPPRKYEKDNRDYKFVSDEAFNEAKENEMLIECRDYQVIYDNKAATWHYFHMSNDKLKSDMEDEKYHWWVAVITGECIPAFAKFFTPERLRVVYIDVNERAQLESLMRREQRQANPNYKEMCRRFLSDQHPDFSRNGIKRICEEAGMNVRKNLLIVDRADFPTFEDIPNEITHIKSSLRINR